MITYVNNDNSPFYKQCSTLLPLFKTKMILYILIIVAVVVVFQNSQQKYQIFVSRKKKDEDY